MTPKVKQLSKQAGDYADVKCQEGLDFYPCYTQKFVELLVKECGNFTDPVTRRLMMKHFGVEE
jgi:hypothetical protein